MGPTMMAEKPLPHNIKVATVSKNPSFLKCIAKDTRRHKNSQVIVGQVKNTGKIEQDGTENLRRDTNFTNFHESDFLISANS